MKALFARSASRRDALFVSRPLAGLRLVVTLPPAASWFGRDLALAKDHALALRALGAKVLAFDTSPCYQGERTRLGRQIDAVRRFRPDAVISTPQAAYALWPRWLEDGAVGTAAEKRIFLDLLALPTVVYWDHVLTQAPMYWLASWPVTVEDSHNGVMERLRQLFRHPRVYHFFPDSGHIAEVNRLGLGRFDESNRYVPSVPQDYFDYADRRRRRDTVESKVAFFGNLSLTVPPSSRHEDSELLEIRRKAQAACAADWDLSPCRAYIDAIDSLADAARERLRLVRDQTYFWQFMNQELSIVANGRLRMDRLLACGRRLGYFGGFADPESRRVAAAAGVSFEEDLPADKRLAAAFRRTQVSLDVVTAPFINGFSHKLFACFASGGFMLTTRKPDIGSSLGALADAIGFSSRDELAGKVDYYLGARRQRDELALEIASIIRRDYSTRALFAKTVPMALDALARR